MKRYGFWAGLGVVLGLLALLAMVLARPYTLRGSVIENPQAAPDFVLTDQNGQAFRLSEQQGKVVVMFFGYTTCPDVCPTTLAELKKVWADLEQGADAVRIVFVTVDPQRDTTQRLHDYLAAYNPAFYGLTGDEADLQLVWNAYGVFRYVRDEGSAAGYLVDHSARTYVIDRQGRLRLTYTFGTPVKDMVADLRYLVKEK
jgi:protein SCO1/2